jgi:hypothetical protein
MTRAALPLSAQEARVAWAAALTLARARAVEALSGGTYDKLAEIELARFGLRAPAFPVGDAPAQGMAKAFVELARTFVATTGAERRAQIAPAIGRLALSLEAVLDEPAIAAARLAAERIGEREA